MNGSKWKNPKKWMIWAHPYFWKHPYILTGDALGHVRWCSDHRIGFLGLNSCWPKTSHPHLPNRTREVVLARSVPDTVCKEKENTVKTTFFVTYQYVNMSIMRDLCYINWCGALSQQADVQLFSFSISSWDWTGGTQHFLSYKFRCLIPNRWKLLVFVGLCCMGTHPHVYRQVGTTFG